MREAFLVLFECSSNCYASIDSLLVSQNNGLLREWNINFVRYFNDGEVEVVVCPLYFNTPREGTDGLRWRLKRSLISVLITMP